MPFLTAIVGLGFLGFVVTVAVIVARNEASKRNSAWDAAAQSFGLSMPPRGFWSTTAEALSGAIDGMEVSVKGHGGKGAQTIYEMAVPSAGLQITAEGFSSTIGKWISGDDVKIGDPRFDAAAVLRGGTGEIRALFDVETRAAAMHLLKLGGWVADGKMKIVAGGLETKQEKLEERIDAMAQLARRLARAHRIAPSERLAAIAKSDPIPGVRANALASLLERRLPQETVNRVIETALQDPDPGNRFAAAKLPLVPPALSRRVLVSLVRESRTPDAVRAKAITALGRFEGITDADGLLDGVLERGVNEARIAAIEALVLRQAHASRIVPFAGRSHGPTRAAVAHALGTIGTSVDQPLLLGMLDDEEEEVRLAAIGALGAIGGIGAVEKLRSLTGLLGGAISRRAENAISAIQSRASGAGAGQLSVSDPPPSAGSLSRPAEDGAVSDPDEPPPATRARKTPA